MSPNTYSKSVRPKAGLLALIPPFLSQKTAIAIYPHIYLPRSIYLDFLKGDYDSSLLLVLSHEQIHLDRQREMGLFIWMIKYCLDRKFRLQEELYAVKSSIELARKIGVEIDLDKISKNLSGPLYLWMAEYDDVYAVLSKY
jgi:hypothetical protein